MASGQSNPVNPGASSSEIKQDIHRTRANMDETVDALGNRLQPRHLVDDVIGWIRGSFQGSGSSSISESGTAVKDAGSMALEKLKQHPLPAALIGAGVVWLLLEGDEKSRQRAGVKAGAWPPDYDPDGPPTHSGSYVDARTGKPYDPATYGAEFRRQQRRGQSTGMGRGTLPPTLGEGISSESSSGGGIGSAVSGAASKVGAVLESAKDAVTGAVGSATSALGSAGEQVGDWAGSAGEYTASGASSAGRYTRQGYGYSRDAIREATEDYPLAVGVAALAVGVIAGLALPGTRREDELMGEQSDQLKSAAMETGGDLLERGTDAAADIAEAATNTVQAVVGEARDQDLSPGSLAEKVKHVASAALRAGTDAAREEGITPKQVSDKGRTIAERAKEVAKDEAQGVKDKLKQER